MDGHADGEILAIVHLGILKFCRLRSHQDTQAGLGFTLSMLIDTLTGEYAVISFSDFFDGDSLPSSHAVLLCLNALCCRQFLSILQPSYFTEWVTNDLALHDSSTILMDTTVLQGYADTSFLLCNLDVGLFLMLAYLVLEQNFVHASMVSVSRVALQKE